MKTQTLLGLLLLVGLFGGIGYLIWRYRTFLRESRTELQHKVTWPTRSEVRGTTGVVLVMVAFMSVLLFAVDTVLHFGVQEIVRLFAGAR